MEHFNFNMIFCTVIHLIVQQIFTESHFLPDTVKGIGAPCHGLKWGQWCIVSGAPCHGLKWDGEWGQEAGKLRAFCGQT